MDPRPPARRARHRARTWVLLVGIAAAGFGLVAGLRARRAGSADVVARVRQAAPMHVAVIDRRVDAAGHETALVALSDEFGRVQASIRFPARRSAPVPVIVVLGGWRTGRRAIDLVDPGMPFAVAALDYAWTGPPKPGWIGLLARIPRLRRDGVRTAIALRDLTRFVARDPRAAAEHVFLVGASLGAPIACAVAAAEPPTGLAILYGFADHAALIEYRLRPHVGPARLRSWIAVAAARLSAPLDCARTLPQLCGTPVLVVAAPDDADLPPQCTEALWAATCEPRRRVDLRGGHIQGARQQEVLRQATRVVGDWLADLGAAAAVMDPAAAAPDPSR